MDERTVGSWAWPGFWAMICLVGLWYAVMYFGRQVWMLIILMAGVLLVAVAAVHWLEYVQERREAAVEARQAAMSRSADAVLLAEARMLAAQSPELAGELAKRIGRPDLILFPTKQGRRPQIKLAGSEVTLQFAIKALDLSDEVYMVAQRQFGEGTYLYDHNRDVADRQQWMQFNWVLSREGMVQRYVPGAATNTAPMWLPPWTPQRVLDLWLLPSDLVEILQGQLLTELDEKEN